MKLNKSLKKSILFFLLFGLLILFLELNTLNNLKLRSSIYKYFSNIFSPVNNYYTISLKSNCGCRQNLIIKVYENFTSINLENVNQNSTHLYDIRSSELSNLNFTCDLYNSLRRGKSQKVIGYSLYNKNKFYYNKLKEISLQLKRVYPPGWIMKGYFKFKKKLIFSDFFQFFSSKIRFIHF
jgi:hypothetical protein